MLTEPIAVTLLVVEALEALDIPYFIGGSLASAVYGVVRATMDVDLVADLRMDQVKPFTLMFSSLTAIIPVCISQCQDCLWN